MRHLLLPLLLAAQLLSAQDDAPYKLKVETRLVQVNATVYNKRTAAPIAGLTPADFRVFDNGVEQPVLYARKLEEDTRPLSLVLVLGYYPFARNSFVPLAAHAAEAFSHLRPSDQVAIVIYGSHRDVDGVADRKPAVRVVQELTGDIPHVLSILTAMSTSPELVAYNSREEKEAGRASKAAKQQGIVVETINQAFDRALAFAIPLSKSVAGVRPEVIAVGNDDSEAPKPQAVATADSLLRADLNLNSLIHTSMMGNMLKGLARNIPNNPNQPEVQNYYCAQTGGVCLQPKPADFGKGLEQLLAQVSAQYSVGWKPAAADGAFHTIRVEFRNPAAHKDAVIKAQRGYYASTVRP